MRKYKAMFLSILIPTYNYDCSALVAELAKQAACVEGLLWEIIVGDDGSTLQEVLVANRKINNIPCCEYWERGCNSGRSAIRNALYRRSRGTHLLFLDGDGMPACNAFLSCYVAEAMREPVGVLCGGILHPEVLPSPAVSLRWRYEKCAEKRMTVEWRNAHPYTNFRSFNFLIYRESFSRLLFDENIKQYGFEDNLFGQALCDNGVAIKHIDNPMLNIDIEPNALYIKKNEEALATLAKHYAQLAPHVRLAVQLGRVERCHMGWLLSLAYDVLRPLLMKNLLSDVPRVWVLNFYKAGFLRSLLKGRCKNSL